MSKAEASIMDPQQRFMLELSYEAFENAGVRIHELSNSPTGCFVGAMWSDWREGLARDPEGAPAHYATTGSGTEFLSNRVSWFYDLNGPSFTVNTACSSSLVALHLACASLRAGECDAALAAGVNLILNPDPSVNLGGQDFLSPDGKSKAFDASANGYGRGEGCAAVVLKRVADAIRDGDEIRSVIRMTGVNQDGKTKSITLPDENAQARLIRSTYASAGLDMRDTSYFEAHVGYVGGAASCELEMGADTRITQGTGTKAGDPIELGAIMKTLTMARKGIQTPLYVGSVKTNIGHCEAASGIAAVVKSVLMLENEQIPPNLHFNSPNPEIPFDEWGIHIPTRLIAWPSSAKQRLSVNSFGAGGTNAHAILESRRSYLDVPRSDDVVMQFPKRQRLFFLQSQDKAGLQRERRKLQKHIHSAQVPAKDLDSYLARLSFTLSERRSKLAWTSYVAASTLDELGDSLGDESSRCLSVLSTDNSPTPRVAFVFSGQGAQWPRMGVELLQYPAFQKSILAADEFLISSCGSTWSVLEELTCEKTASRINDPVVSQPMSVILQVAIVEMLSSWGIQCTAVVGHSSGEVAAAFCAGAISREDAWAIAYAKGSCLPLLDELAPGGQGSMMAAGITEDQANEYINTVAKAGRGRVVAACINSPSSITLSGDTSGIDEIQAILQHAGLFHRKLQVRHAYHSHHMAPLAAHFEESISGRIEGGHATDMLPMFSSVHDGRLVGKEELTEPAYWIKNLLSPVRFSQAVAALVRGASPDILVEIGPHSTLKGPINQILRHHNLAVKNYHAVLLRNENDALCAVEMAGALYAQQVPVNIATINGYTGVMKPLTCLPPYEWNHSSSYWAEPRLNFEHRQRIQPRRDLIGAPVPDVAANQRAWRGFLRPKEEPWIKDHRIMGDILYPAAGFLTMAVEGARQLADEEKFGAIKTFRIRDFNIEAPAVIPEDGSLEVSLTLHPKKGGILQGPTNWLEFVISTRSADDHTSTWRQNCAGLVRIEYEPKGPDSEVAKESNLSDARQLKDVEKIRRLSSKKQSANHMFTTLDNLGLNFGPTFRNLSSLETGLSVDGKWLMSGSIVVPEFESTFKPIALDGREERAHIIHPTTLDALIQCFCSAALGSAGLRTGMVPRRIDEVVLRASVPYKPGERFQAVCSAAKHGMKDMVSDAVATDSISKEPLITIKHLYWNPLGSGEPDIGALDKKFCFQMLWTPSIRQMTDLELSRWLQTFKPNDKLPRLLEAMCRENGEISLLELGSPLSTGPRVVEALASLSLASGHVTLDTQGFPDQESSQKFPFNVLGTIPTEGEYHLVIKHDFGDLNASNLGHLLASQGRITVLDRLSGNDLDIQPESITNGVIASSWDQNELVVVIEAATASEKFHNFGEQLATYLALDSRSEVRRFIWGSSELTEIITNQKKRCVFLLDLEHSFLDSLAEPDFVLVKTLLLSSKSSLWVTALETPALGMAFGLARVLKNESAGVAMRVVQIPSVLTCPLEKLSQILQLGEEEEDIEFRIHETANSVVDVRRVQEHVNFNSDIRDIKLGGNVPTKVRDAKSTLKLGARTIGTLEGLRYEPVQDVSGDPQGDEVDIGVKATGINFRDVLTCMGEIPDETLGLEAAGIVIAAGPLSTLQPGDRVCCLGAGSHKTRLRVSSVLCQVLPDNMNFAEGASMPVVFATAYHALVNLAHLDRGDSVLIHAAAGGVGQAALQIAKYLDLEIYVTVGSQEKRDLVEHQFGVPSERIFNSRDLSFGLAVQRATRGRGVDCVLNSLAGEALQESWRSLAPHGTFVEIGMKDILSNSALDMKPFVNNATFCFFNLQLMQKAKKSLMARILTDTFRLVRKGVLRPVEPVLTFKASEAEKAFRLMQTGKHRGKLVLNFDDEHDELPVSKTVKSLVRLSSDKSYVLVGGLGGLGRSISNLLVANGARSLCFISRSGAATSSAAALIDELESAGTRVQVLSSDIADKSCLQAALAKIKEPIGGVIQSAMVLRDALFETMTYDQWSESLAPKVTGTWNLHNLVPNEHLDFFLMLSSFSGIFGNRGQANYAAGCVFQDELAHFRKRQGFKAASIDL